MPALSSTEFSTPNISLVVSKAKMQFVQLSHSRTHLHLHLHITYIAHEKRSEAARDALTALTHIAHDRIMIIIVGVNIPTLLAKSGPWCLTGSSALSAETGLVVHLVNLQSLHSLSLYCHLRNAMPSI